MEYGKEIGRYVPEHTKGLSLDEVAARREAGLVNVSREKISKTNWQIIRDNVFTVFNLFNLLIGIALAAVGAFVNMAYLLVILLNVMIGIVQELRARALVSKLALITESKACVVRQGAQQEIGLDGLVLDDIVVLEAGRQIPADAEIIYGEIEVNESLLTGEPDAILKQKNDKVLSGSFVVSGKAYSHVQRVGADNFAAKLALEAKRHKKINSRLLQDMRKVTRFTGFFIVPLGIALFLEAFLLRSDAIDLAVISSAAALLGMLPKGLVLLISIALAAGVISLAKKRILVQELYSLENLARADVLCLDKTGTITKGEMEVSDFYITDQNAVPADIKKVLGAFVRASEDNNATLLALKKYFTQDEGYKTEAKIAFSSQRKWSAVSFSGLGTVVVGAPEKLYGGVISKRIAESQNAGRRVLCVGFTTQKISKDAALPPLKIAAVIEIDDPVRKNANQALDFFYKQGVDVKIISGDNPLTAATAAKRAGFRGLGHIDMTGIDTEQQIAEAAKKYGIFGRVTPVQKKMLVKAFQADGRTVAMVGDGVNDVLALKDADCGIAMASGSDAARQVSQLVLLDSDFTSLPEAVKEGRRVVNNVTRVAGVFFVKTVYSVLLSLLFIGLNVPFPFAPVQITLIDLAIEGYPAFFMSFEKSYSPIEEDFLHAAVRRALPNAVLITLSVVAVMVIAKLMPLSTGQSLAVMYFVTGFISLLAVVRACLPFNKLRTFLSSTSAIGFYTAIILFHQILKLELPDKTSITVILILAAVCLPLILLLSFVTEKAWVKIKKM